MSKLFNLKKWLTVSDAARHLSQIISEPVCDADILQLALDGHIKLTVDFPNRARACLGQVMPFRDVPRLELPSLDGKGIIHTIDGFLLKELEEGEQLTEETPFLHFGKDVVTIDGLWDLAMLGNERFDIEYLLQELIGGPEVTMMNIAGTFLNRNDGTWASLQDKFPDRTVTNPSNKVEKIEGHYYPAGGLGSDCTKVIRTSEILNLQSHIEGRPVDKPMGNTERKTLLTIIAALAKDAKLNINQPGKAAVFIEGLTDELGAHVSKRAIEDHLKKIPDALETRMK